MNTWKINFGWRQVADNGRAPCGCLGAKQICHYESPQSGTGIVECGTCGATWGDYDGDEWVHGDRAPDAPLPVSSSAEEHPDAPGDCELPCCM